MIIKLMKSPSESAGSDDQMQVAIKTEVISLEEMLEAMECFIKACGFCIEDGELHASYQCNKEDD